MEPHHHDRVLEYGDPWQGASILTQHQPNFIISSPPSELNRWGGHSEDAAHSHVDISQRYLQQARSATVFSASIVPSSWWDEPFKSNPALSNASASINDNGSTRLQPSGYFVAADPQRHEATLHPTHVTEQLPSNSSRRSRYTPLDWNGHRTNIAKLYIDEDKSLEVTRTEMAEKFGFDASIKLYKDKVKQWGWSKYLSSSNAQWMLKKADKRKRHEEKDTEFKVGIRAVTLDCVYRTVKRSKNKDHQINTDDAPTPSGVTYSTPRNEMPSPSSIINRTIPHPQIGTGTSVPTSLAEVFQTPALSHVEEDTNSDPVATDKPALVTCQLDLADARVKTKDETVEPLLLGLIAQCEKNPEKLGLQALKARSSLIKLYKGLGEDGKVGDALHHARAAISTVLKSGHKITESILDAAVELMGCFVMAENYDVADTLFLEVESKAVEIFGSVDYRTINMLIRIGMLFQGQQRWIDARPRFEQALAASMVSAGLKNDLTKRLEAALDNQHYDPGLSMSEDVVFRRYLIQLKDRES